MATAAISSLVRPTVQWVTPAPRVSRRARAERTTASRPKASPHAPPAPPVHELRGVLVRHGSHAVQLIARPATHAMGHLWRRRAAATTCTPPPVMGCAEHAQRARAQPGAVDLPVESNVCRARGSLRARAMEQALTCFPRCANRRLGRRLGSSKARSLTQPTAQRSKTFGMCLAAGKHVIVQTHATAHAAATRRFLVETRPIDRAIIASIRSV